MMPDPEVQALFVGAPKEMVDDRGCWTSSILRDRVTGPIKVTLRGIEGDRVTQPYHGGPGAAVCAHLDDHYVFWRERYGIEIGAGAVGENVTLAGITEDEICVGDCVRLGTALLQVSGPRTPCANLARQIGRPDWVKLTVRENRTGFYMRVLEEGLVAEGDAWSLQDRLNETGTIPAINRCMYLRFDPEYARAMLSMAGLEDWWKEQARAKLEAPESHWSAGMRDA